MQQSYDTLIEKWAPVLDEGVAIKDHHKRQVTAAILENQERALQEERSALSGFLTENAAAPGNSTSGVSNFDQVLI